METRTKYLPYFFVLGAGASWGFMGLFSKNILAAGYSSFTVVLIRNMGALIALSLIFALRDRSVFKISPKHLPIFAGTGIVSVFLFAMCYFTGLKYNSMAVASVLLYTAPGFVILMSALVYHEKITKRKLAALALTVFGCASVTGLWSGGLTITPRGFLLGIGSAVTYATYSIISPLALRHYKPMTCTFYTFVFAGPASLVLLDVDELAGIVSDPALLSNAVAFVFISTVIPYMCYTKGLSLVEPGKASIMVSIEPAVAALAGAVFLGEPLTMMVAVGIACVLGAVYILR